MKQKIKALLILVAVAAASVAAHAKEGTVGNGGETINVDGRPSLRDLVDKTTCVWESGTRFLERLSEFSRIIEAIRPTHWYLAYLIEREARDLKICPSNAPLITVTTNDLDGLAVFELETRQVAIRIADRVYLDNRIFSQMRPLHQAFLYVHEIMHRFIPRDTLMRNSKLRSLISALHHHMDHPLTKSEFGLQLSMNGVAITPVSAPLDGFESLVETAGDGLNEETTQYAAGKLYASDKLGYLFTEDARKLRERAERVELLLWHEVFAETPDLRVIETMVKAGANGSARRENGVGLRHFMPSHDLLIEAVIHRVERPAAILATSPLAKVNRRYFNWQYRRVELTVLHDAVIWGLSGVIDALLKRADLEVNARDGEGMTALLHAVKGQNVSVVRKILDRGDVDVHIAVNGKAAWDIAAEEYTKAAEDVYYRRLEHRRKAMEAYYEICRMISQYRRAKPLQ